MSDDEAYTEEYKKLGTPLAHEGRRSTTAVLARLAVLAAEDKPQFAGYVDQGSSTGSPSQQALSPAALEDRQSHNTR